MSISSEISRIKSNVTSAYSALSAKGATMPSVLNTANLKSTIESIPEGVEPEAMSIETIWEICGYVPSGLPSGYTLLEYIQSNGTQYIDSGVFGKSGLSAKSTFAINSTGECMLLGCFGSYRCFVLYFNKLQMYYGYYQNYPDARFAITAGQKYSAEVNLSVGNQSLKINGETKITSALATSYTNTRNLYIFAFNNGGTPDLYTSAKLYDLQIYDNGTLVRDFVPCINPNGVYGLYDKANEKFYANAGSGSFTGA